MEESTYLDDECTIPVECRNPSGYSGWCTTLVYELGDAVAWIKSDRRSIPKDEYPSWVYRIRELLNEMWIFRQFDVYFAGIQAQPVSIGASHYPSMHEGLRRYADLLTGYAGIFYGKHQNRIAADLPGADDWSVHSFAWTAAAESLQEGFGSFDDEYACACLDIEKAKLKVNHPELWEVSVDVESLKTNDQPQTIDLIKLWPQGTIDEIPEPYRNNMGWATTLQDIERKLLGASGKNRSYRSLRTAVKSERLMIVAISDQKYVPYCRDADDVVRLKTDTK